MLENVARNDAPGASVPEPVKPPSSETTEWLTAPSFVQQTVVPTGMLSELGLKAYSPTETVVSPAWHDVAAIAGAVPAPGSAATNTTANPTATARRAPMRWTTGRADSRISPFAGRNVRRGP